MKVFISWSGTKSQEVALVLRDWLPGVINSIEPFVSAKDVYAGTRWQSEIASQLDGSNFGIVCVTQENQFAPWLNFEAGALAKAVDTSRLVPLAIDLKPSDVELPLGQFQAQPATKDGMKAVLVSLNGALGEAALPSTLLDSAFDVWWPSLEKRLTEIEQTRVPGAPAIRTDRELLEETLDTVRSLARGIDRLPSPDMSHRSAVDTVLALLHQYDVDTDGVVIETSPKTPGLITVRVPETAVLPGAVRTRLRREIVRQGYEVTFAPHEFVPKSAPEQAGPPDPQVSLGEQ